jgi:hypothetical protein
MNEANRRRLHFSSRKPLNGPFHGSGPRFLVGKGEVNDNNNSGVPPGAAARPR